MTERPILFSAEMVRAILEGRKTQTRLVMKPQPSAVDAAGRWYRMESGGESLINSAYPCPYGQPDDLLWVREDFYVWGRYHKTGATKNGRKKWRFEPVAQRASVEPDRNLIGNRNQRDLEKFWPRHRTFMPRWASRITLRITNVRVEQLKGISKKDAISEGIEHHPGKRNQWRDYHSESTQQEGFNDPRNSFFTLWKTRYTPPPSSYWGGTWVWVIEFERVKP